MQNELKITIYYEDTDAGGVVYHANYLKYLERARTEFLRSIGASQSNLIQQNIVFVVKSVSINYQNPARLDEQLTITSKISKLKPATMIFEQQISIKQKKIAFAEVRIACLTADNFKITSIPTQIVGKIN